MHNYECIALCKANKKIGSGLHLLPFTVIKTTFLFLQKKKESLYNMNNSAAQCHNNLSVPSPTPDS